MLKDNLTRRSLVTYRAGIITSYLVSLVTAAHFIRAFNPGLALVSAAAPLILLYKRKWTLLVFKGLMTLWSIEWIRTAFIIATGRAASGAPWGRAAVIIGAVAVVAIGCAALLSTESFRRKYTQQELSANASGFSFALSSILLAIPHVKLSGQPALMAERFFFTAGWTQILVLSLYAALLTEKLLSSESISRIRSIAWTILSCIFFAQALLGISGLGIFLMSDTLHLPVPAMIVAGPIFRGEIFGFMSLLFLVTVVLTGPAWCSWFCYLGAWDFTASKTKAKAGILPKHSLLIRAVILIGVVSIAAIMGAMGAASWLAAIAGAFFGLAGIAIMLLFSKNRGTMLHCTMYCPISLLASTLGKINPFRIKIASGCTDCNICSTSCRYGALTLDNIRNRKPGFTCTLCGDCISSCHKQQIQYRFFTASPSFARKVFTVLIVSIHVVFIGLGRI